MTIYAEDLNFITIELRGVKTYIQAGSITAIKELTPDPDGKNHVVVDVIGGEHFLADGTAEDIFEKIQRIIEGQNPFKEMMDHLVWDDDPDSDSNSTHLKIYLDDDDEEE